VKPFVGALAAAALLCALTSRAAEVTVDTVGYQINLGSNNKISLSRVASVPLGKPCVASTSLTDPYRTVHIVSDRMLAVMDPNPKKPGTFLTRPRQVWAKCAIATCTAPKPADEERPGQCPTGTTGAWTQKLTYVSAPYPDCWKAGEWLPKNAPAGICTTPPVAKTLVYACADAGADGRILEGNGVTWPNCAGAGYKTPSRSLVVAVNPGSQPLMWRRASKLTDERIWTQTGTVGAWTRANTIDWATVAPPPPPAVGTANLRWPPSTENSDGTALTNLAGYRIVYGTSYAAGTDDMHPDAHVIDVGAGVTSYVIEQLPPATYYFSVLARNAAGKKSWPSPVLGIAIR
jgi:hypothetical protein